MTAPRPAPHDLRPDGCELVDAAGTRFLNLGYLPAADGGAGDPALGARLSAAFAEECTACAIDADLDGPPEAPALRFAGQENATGARIRQAFDEECTAQHLLCGERLVVHPAMTAADAARAESALRAVVRRLRTLLIEHNSYLSGGLRYPFPDPLPGVAARGLAIYRYPADGAVDVVAEGDRVRIAFAPGRLGAVTSSGFYLPTLFEGDFTVVADYTLGAWRPCATEAACLALFAQNETSSHRYYAQRMSTGDQPHRLLASMADELSPEQDAAGLRGRFRIRRHGPTITCEHAEPGTEDWRQLGRAPGPAEPVMVLGAKIWSKARSDGLEATIADLRIEGHPAARQIPPVPVREDPRSHREGPS